MRYGTRSTEFLEVFKHCPEGVVANNLAGFYIIGISASNIQYLEKMQLVGQRSLTHDYIVVGGGGVPGVNIYPVIPDERRPFFWHRHYPGKHDSTVIFPRELWIILG
jgi:hypothetical protein